ncbi:MAG: AAA family ATPase [Candidatus Pacebacteria bacterium]|nr:AAA family ATPase [Candidatus Paceibacterota bacterium]
MKDKLKNKKLFLMIINGPTGAGKTTLSKILHAKLKRTAHTGLDKVKRYISDFKRNPTDNEISRNVAIAMTQEYLKQGISVIYDEPMTKERAISFKKMAKKYGARYFLYQLHASEPVVQLRVAQRTELLGKPKISKARVKRNYGLYMKHKSKDATIFDSEKMSSEQIASLILKELKNI